MITPQVSLLNAIKRILKYMKGTHSHGFLYQSLGHFRIEGYAYIDWAGSPHDRKSTIGYCIFLVGNLIT